jgi:hypothetical protein
VFVHDAVAYMTTERELRAAIETAFVHCRPGGAALFAPDHVRPGPTARPGKTLAAHTRPLPQRLRMRVGDICQAH